MGKMKFIYVLAQQPTIVQRIKSLIKKAKAQKLNYAYLDDEFMTLEQLDAILTLVLKHKENQKLEPDDTLRNVSD
jgi:hypothetical protein